jgi:hypothetical protein
VCSGCSGNYETEEFKPVDDGIVENSGIYEPEETDEREEGGDLEEGDPFGLGIDENGDFENP